MDSTAGLDKTTQPLPFVERRQRKPDLWSRALRGITLLVYPVLIINLFIFAMVAGEAQKQQVVNENIQQNSALAPALAMQNSAATQLAMQNLSGWVNLHAFLPVMIGGLLISFVGLFLSRKRARRRYDYKFQNQLILIILSVFGLVAYLVLA
jgi:hypothetical protein